CIYCQPTSRKTIDLTCADHTEVAGAEHAENFIVFIFAIDRIKHFKTSKTKIFYGVFIMLNIAKIEVIMAIFNAYNRSCGNFVYFNRRVKVHPLMVELELEWSLQVAPVCFVTVKLDLLIVRIFHIAEDGG